jgi:hypothetical protein
MIAVIGVVGGISRYPDGTLPVFSVNSAVRVNLARDGEHVGTVTFSHLASATNPRATIATYLLTGSYIQVQGEAMFEVDDTELLTQVLEEL